MVERWSSKPYAWVRFLLPLYKISSTLGLKQIKTSQHNYFNSTLKQPFKKLNSYKAFFSKLFSKKQSKINRIYFKPAVQISKLASTRRPGLLFSKLNLRITCSNNLLVVNSSYFQMFLNNQMTSILGVDNKTTQRAFWPNYTNKTNVSYGLNSLRFPTNPTSHTAPVLQQEFILKSPTNPKLLGAYYSNLQPKGTRFITHFQLLKKLTSRYGLVRKIQNNWEHFQTRKNQLSRFSNHNLPTLSLNVPVKYNVSPSQTVTNMKSHLVSTFKQPSAPAAHSTNLFNNLFSRSLFTSFLVYKRFYNASPLITERPGKLITKYFYSSPHNVSLTFSNIICVNLPRTPKLLLNLKDTKATKFQTNFLCWYNFLLIRFLQHTTGLKISLVFNPSLHKTLSLSEQAQLDLWTQRVKGFQRIIGPKISLKESLQVTYLSLKLKDPSLLSSWLSRTIHKVSFWKYRAFFRYLKFLLQNLFLPSFPFLEMKGVKLKLKGKVSVAGNARTRSIYYRVGSTGQSTFNSRVLHNLTFFYTFTGILGLQIWFYF